ncbi:MAG: hypothetical protein ACK4ND_11850 [Cytophagaceae bacterium]
MKLLVFTSIFIGLFSGFMRIHRINNIQENALQHYEEKDFAKASKMYKVLYNEFHISDDKMILNLANACYQAKDTACAKEFYSLLSSSDNQIIKSTAHHQMGILSFESGRVNEALHHFKISLRTNPDNELAGYNYEILSKLSHGNEVKIKIPKTAGTTLEANQLSGDIETQDGINKGNEFQRKNEPDASDPGTNERELLLKSNLYRININKTKAERILEELRHKEIQYWQEKTRFSENKNDQNKDW